MILIRVPLRITLGGGGTDQKFYSSQFSGFTMSMAINKYMYLEYHENLFGKPVKLRYYNNEFVDSIDTIQNDRAREMLRLFSPQRFEIVVTSDIPSHTGLGSSGSFLVGLSALMRRVSGIELKRTDIAEEASKIEMDILNYPSGKQDQYIAAYGNAQAFIIEKDGTVCCQTLPFNYEMLTRHMRLFYTNVQRVSSLILTKQSQNHNLRILHELKGYGYVAQRLLLDGNFDEYGKLLDKLWTLKKMMSPDISNGKLDEIYEQLKQEFGVLGGKLIGAGGGGFFLVYHNGPWDKVEEYMRAHEYEPLVIGPDYDGVKQLIIE